MCFQGSFLRKDDALNRFNAFLPRDMALDGAGCFEDLEQEELIRTEIRAMAAETLKEHLERQRAELDPDGRDENEPA